jgi:hypothetical protein
MELGAVGCSWGHFNDWSSGNCLDWSNCVQSWSNWCNGLMNWGGVGSNGWSWSSNGSNLSWSSIRGRNWSRKGNWGLGVDWCSISTVVKKIWSNGSNVVGAVN